MKITHASLAPTAAADVAGRPALPPELMAAVAARYSRSDEGLSAILGRVDQANPERSIDSIFNMVDYGHQSIADMAPVAMFMDGLSIWLVYHLWAMLPRAVGQETSTRYVRWDEDGMLDEGLLSALRTAGAVGADQGGAAGPAAPGWREFVSRSFALYEAMSDYWRGVAEREPERMGLPPDLLAAAQGGDAKAARQVERMSRNFVFDRARYWIPAAALTNVMMILPARDWAMAARALASHPLAEAQALAEALRSELALVAPRMLRHAGPSDDWRDGQAIDLEDDAALAAMTSIAERNAPAVEVTVDAPAAARSALARAFSCHPNRYSWVGREARRVHGRYAIDGVAMAELRDLNRHRTGYKHCPQVPLGFYGARDQMVVPSALAEEAIAFGLAAAERQRAMLATGDPAHVYWGLLGTQYRYEHGTALNHLAYEVELRTGLGAHYRYADHMRAVHNGLVAALPEVEGLIIVGQGEPE